MEGRIPPTDNQEPDPQQPLEAARKDDSFKAYSAWLHSTYGK
jgi:hypothetical protein